MKIKKIALIGNPNSGKSTIFNQLTGLHQHIANHPGVTVEKKIGTMQIDKGHTLQIMDLPGTYSIFPKTEDEKVVLDILGDKNNPDHPDLAIVVADITNLERNLLFFSQIYDLQIPAILCLTMTDLAEKNSITVNSKKLSQLLGNTPIITINAQGQSCVKQIEHAIASYSYPKTFQPFISKSTIINRLFGFSGKSNSFPSEEEQIADTHRRYKKISSIVANCCNKNITHLTKKKKKHFIDKIITHPIWGYVIFLSILFLMFQAIYEFASLPMNWIDYIFLRVSQNIKSGLPDGALTNILAEGIIPGIGGVIVFIPQIAILFFFIAILEETGYMSRVVFIMDRVMQPFGLSGKSVVPLISGVACAVPAIMATRNIDQWKDRLITIMVTPLIGCSARLPVYTLLIALVVPDIMLMGFINFQGLVLLGMYLLGFLAALGAAILFKLIIKTPKRGFLIMEMPTYKFPYWKSVGITVIEKVKIFVLEAGKIIVAISIILWVLASYGPPNSMKKSIETHSKMDAQQVSTPPEDSKQIASDELENSWVGIFGKKIEPIIAPLGYNWQIGIALITSFAAREVFVGTMAIIYSVGEDFENDHTMIQRMQLEENQKTGKKVYNLASGISLMVFYAFAMQCMSTLAVVRRETKTWKWPLVQFVYMTLLAYGSAFITYILLS